MNNFFIPVDFFRRNYHQWWLFAVLMIAGGVFGLVFSNFQSPIYESKAVFSITIDYSRTGAVSDIQEDQAMRGIANVIESDAVLQKTLDATQEIGLDFSIQDFKQKSFLEREGFSWTLRIRDSNPKTAADLVNLWAENAYLVLKDATYHALRADSLIKYLDSLEYCLERTTAANESYVPCKFPNLMAILSEIQSTGEIAYKEKEASLGMMAALDVKLVEKGKAAISPVIFRRSSLVFAGMVIGLVFAVILFIVRNGEKTIQRDSE